MPRHIWPTHSWPRTGPAQEQVSERKRCSYTYGDGAVCVYQGQLTDSGMCKEHDLIARMQMNLAIQRESRAKARAERQAAKHAAAAPPKPVLQGEAYKAHLREQHTIATRERRRRMKLNGEG